MICEIVDSIDNDTHTLFIGKLIEADIYREKEEMSYGYYQEHKEELLKVTTEKGKQHGYAQYADIFTMETKYQKTLNVHYVE